VSRALKAETAQPVPRVRPEAAEIANQHKGFIKNLIVDVSNKPKSSKCTYSLMSKFLYELPLKQEEGSGFEASLLKQYDN
jgi:hypothetical protein